MSKSAQATGLSQLNGIAKTVYGEEMIPLYSDMSHVLKRVPFKVAKRIGSTYNFPVGLTYETGFTFSIAANGAFSLVGPTSMTTKEATVNATQIVLQSQIDYETAAKSQGSEAAFKAAAGLVVENANQSFTQVLEAEVLYGAHSMGQVASKAGTDTAPILTISTASWAPGLWCGKEGAYLDVLDDSSGSPTGTRRAYDYYITAVDPVNRTVTLAVDAGGGNAIQTDDHLMLLGSGVANASMTGLFKIMSNAGTLFGISAATYSLWKASTYSAASGRLSLAKILKGASLPVAKGLSEKLVGFVSNPSWADLAADFNAARIFDSSYSEKGKAGVLSISFAGPNGEIEIVPHPMVKEGHALFLPPKRVARIGGTDVTNKVPGRGDEMFSQLATAAGFEFRLYSDQAIICETPAKMLLINNIVNG